MKKINTHHKIWFLNDYIDVDIKNCDICVCQRFTHPTRATPIRAGKTWNVKHSVVPSSQHVLGNKCSKVTVYTIRLRGIRKFKFMTCVQFLCQIWDLCCHLSFGDLKILLSSRIFSFSRLQTLILNKSWSKP